LGYAQEARQTTPGSPSPGASIESGWREGIGADRVADAPPPSDEGPDDWHKAADWWADLLGHYGLFDSAGKGNEPFLHPAQR
jgi:hypothetical protein